MKALLTREELFVAIRREKQRDGSLSGRALCKLFRVSNRTVAAALASPVPPAPKPRRRRPSTLEPARGWIDAMLREDLSAPRKQKHTIERMCRRLAAEHDFDAAHSTVRDYVAWRRPEIVAEARDGRRHLEGTVPQLHLAGEEAEVDFADVWVRLAGVLTKCRLFTLRMSYSGKAIHRVFASQGQEAFLQGHLEAFRVLGGVPTRHIRYDNLRPAVSQVCFGRSRTETVKWAAFRSWAGFEAFYCIPGIEGAHEKGGVEHEGGRFRRQHLVPVLEVEDLASLNARLAEIDAAEDARFVHGRTRTVGFDFAVEAEQLRALPGEDFDCGTTLSPLVRRDSRIVVRQCYYSVPARLIGRRVRVSLRANEVLVFDGRHVIARHPRLSRRYEYHDILDHYLEILLVKPGAFAGSAALAQARAEGVFTGAHDAFWQKAVAEHGQAAGTRILIEVLLLHRQLPPGAVGAGITVALELGTASADLVAIEARKAAAADPCGLPVPPPRPAAFLADLDEAEEDAAADAPDTTLAEVIALDDARRLPGYTTPLPSVDIYDRLLTRRTKGHTA